jgi:membrane fusion protein (multidrug efflux system)
MVTLRAEFPNPENLLMPGMFARAQIIEGVNASALTVPQRTVVRGAGGASSVLVVTEQNKVEARPIETDRTVGNKVIVTKGLKAGERVMVEGSQQAPPGSVVKPVAFVLPAQSAAQPKAN